MSAVRLLVLGSILRRGVSHGYGVYSDITSWHAETWTNVKAGSIYHALEKLNKQALIEMVHGDHASVKLGPSKTEYTITEQGKEEFRILLQGSLQSQDIQQFAVGIAFMNHLTREEVIVCLSQRYSSLNAGAHFLEQLPTNEHTTDPSQHPELVGTWISYVSNEANNTKRILKAIEQGNYVFLHESNSR